MAKAFGGKKREVTGGNFQKLVGVGEVEVVAVSPDKEELAELGINVEEEPEYLGEDSDGHKFVRIAFYVKEKTTGSIGNISYFLKNNLKEFKDKDTEKVTGYKWINSKGKTAFLEADKDEDSLPAWFVKDAEVRKALDGEEELYNFLTSWVQLDFFKDPEAFMVLDTKKLLKGNVKDLQDLVDNDLTKVTNPKTKEESPATLCVLYTIKTKQDGTEVQIINNRHILGGWNIQFFQGKKFTKKDFKDLIELLEKNQKEKEDWQAINKYKMWQRFAGNILKEQYGVKEFFGTYLGPVREYDASENVAASDEVMTESTEDDGPGYGSL